MGGFGLPGGAVWINPGALRSRARVGAVSLAGPAVNLVIALPCLLPLSTGLVGPDRPVLKVALAFLGFLELVALVLNLLPFPGLDGFGALEPYLPAPLMTALAPVCRWRILILIGVLFYFRPASDLFWRMILDIIDAFSVDRGPGRPGLLAVPLLGAVFGLRPRRPALQPPVSPSPVGGVSPASDPAPPALVWG